MLRNFTCLVLLLATLPAVGQGISDYYRLPGRTSNYGRLLNRYGAATTRERWYVGVEGFRRSDLSVIDNSFDRLVSSGDVGSWGWGISAGWVGRERWAIEAAYVHASIHNYMEVVSGRGEPYRFNSANDKQAFALRLKYRLPLGPLQLRRSGLWVSAGGWLIPNSGNQVAQYRFNGTRFRDSRSNPDTLLLTTSTQIAPNITGMIELGAEYNVQLGGPFELGFFGRKTWGIGNSIRTDLTYSVNGVNPQYGTIVGNGNGWNFGVSVRFNYAIQRHLRSVYEVKGNFR
jgi:hypothetical protein